MKKILFLIAVIASLGTMSNAQTTGGDFNTGRNPYYTGYDTVHGAVNDTLYTPINPWYHSVTFQWNYQLLNGSGARGWVVTQMSAEPSFNPTNNNSNDYVTLFIDTVNNTGNWESFIHTIQGNPGTYYRQIYYGKSGEESQMRSFVNLR